MVHFVSITLDSGIMLSRAAGEPVPEEAVPEELSGASADGVYRCWSEPVSMRYCGSSWM